jgi:hypothetical protein
MGAVPSTLKGKMLTRILPVFSLLLVVKTTCLKIDDPIGSM